MHYFGDNLTYTGKEKLIGYYEKNIKILEEENKKLKELIDDFENGDFFASKQMSFIEKYFILKKKIKDRIEELKYRADGIAGTYQYADSQEHLQEKKKIVIELRTKVEVLEELLKEVNK